MYQRRVSKPLALFALICVAACYPKGAPPPAAPSAAAVTWASTRWPNETAASLAHGRELFVAKCNACHDHPDLGAIADDRWPHIVDRMGGKAHLAPADRDAVLHFILASRSEQTAR
jgi:cytochrome c5